jgi:signal transduction histidine kinase
MRFIQKRIAKYVQPKSQDEDSRRQESILNIILVTSILLLTVLDATVVYNLAIMGKAYDGVTFIPFTVILLIFISLFVLSNKGRVRTASYVLVALYMIGAIYCGYRWGASLPATLLTTTLVIFTSSILIGTRCGMIISVGMVIILSLLGIHEYTVLGVQPWKYMTISTTDVITYSGIFFFITMLSWLSNREIELSLSRARKSELELKKERDNLEITVAERTDSLRKIQLEQMTYLSRSAEFGKLSQGLFHDLMTPLTSISLGLDLIEKTNSPEILTLRHSVRKTVEASQRMSDFMTSVRKTIRYSQENSCPGSETKQVCDFVYSFEHIIQILGYKIRNSGVKVLFNQLGKDSTNPVLVNRNPTDIERILLNLISNSIDSYVNITDAREKIITVDIEKSGRTITISVSDNGCGIAAENMKKVFDPFFTTKTLSGGSGIGLTTVKTLVEENLGGEVHMKSKLGIGTEIRITFQD